MLRFRAIFFFMKKKIVYVLGGLFILLAIFWAQYEFLRYQKIKHDTNCIAPCVQEIIPPSSWSIVTGKYRGGIFGSEVRLPNFRKGCDQSATTTDCSKIPSTETPVVDENNSIIPNTSPSGKIDEHLTINNELRDVNFCGKTYKVKQVMIDGVDVVQRVAELVTKNKDKEACNMLEMRMSSGDQKSAGIEIGVIDIEKNTVKRNEIYAITLLSPTGNFEYLGDFLINITTGNIFIILQKIDVSSTKLIGKITIASENLNDTGDPLLPDLSSSSSTENEKEEIFESKKFGISFRYPVSLFIVEREQWILVTSIMPNNPKRHSSAMMGALSISITEGKTLEDVTKTLAQETLSIKESSLDGYKAKEITSTPDGYSGSTWISLLIETKKGVLNIRYMKDSFYEETYHYIIESIRIQ